MSQKWLPLGLRTNRLWDEGHQKWDKARAKGDALRVSQKWLLSGLRGNPLWDEGHQKWDKARAKGDA